MAWDFISQVSYSERLGFLEKAGDIDNILSSADSSLEYFAVINQFPILDYLFDKNPLRRNKPASFGTVIGIMVSRLIDRQLQSNPDLQAPADTQKDFLDHFIAKKSQFPHVDDNQIISWMSINMLAVITSPRLSILLLIILRAPTRPLPLSPPSSTTSSRTHTSSTASKPRFDLTTMPNSPSPTTTLAPSLTSQPSSKKPSATSPQSPGFSSASSPPQASHYQTAASSRPAHTSE